MSVAGPSNFLDLTLDSDDSLLDFHATIDLTVDSEDLLFDHRRATSANTKAQGDAEFSDNEVLILSSSPLASSSKIGPDTRRLRESESRTTEDERLARRLAREEEENLQKLVETAGKWKSRNAKDERLARRLAQEEEESFKKLVETVENNEDGIVFSVVVNAESNTLEDGSPAHPDDLERFEPWKKLCEGPGIPKVKKFHWFVNYELEKRFELARDTLEAIMGERPPELQLFHGTSATNVDLILKGGFRIGGFDGHPVSNGAALGYGIYFGTSPMISLGYTANSTNKIFACRVVPGRIAKAPIMQPPTSAYVGSEPFECYMGNGVYVHRYASLVLPCYMIEFDMPVYQPTVWMGGLGLPLPARVVLPRPPPRRPRAPRKAKVPATDAAPTVRKRTRKLVADAAAAAVLPQVSKRQRRTLPAEDGDEADAAPPRTSSRKGKGKAKA